MKKSSARKDRAMLGAVVAICVWGLVLADPFEFIHNVEMKLLDARQRTFASKTAVTDDIVIVDISEDSIRALEPVYGRWPWPRSVHGELVGYLAHDGAKVVGFDVLFSEKASRSELSDDEIAALSDLAIRAVSPAEREALRERIESNRPGLADESFAADARDFGRVVQAALFFTSEGAVSENESTRADEKSAARIREIMASSAVGFVEPVSVALAAPVFHNATVPMSLLAGTAAAVGHVNFTPDADGPCRRTILFAAFQSSRSVFPSLPLAMAVVGEGLGISGIVASVAGVKAGERVIPTDADGSLLIRYQGGEFRQREVGPSLFVSHYKSYDYYAVLLSLEQVAAGELPTIPPGTFDGKYVLVGSTAGGLKDLRATPFTATSPGVEIHANVLDNILAGKYLVTVSPTLARVGTAIMAITVALAAAFAGPWMGFIATAIVMSGSLAGSWFAFGEGIVVPMAGQASSGALAFLGVVLGRFIIEEKEKRKLRHAFGHYLSSAVLNEVLSDPESLELGGRKRHMTVLFSDIAGFTKMSEALEPEVISRLLNGYLNRMVACVLDTGGILDKFIGDAIVAEWNAPGEVPDHAARACECALRMQKEADLLRTEWKAAGARDLHVRIGVNTGDMVVGNMGSDELFDYTVIGNEVNTGARLEPLNKEFGSRIAISRTTFDEAERHRPGEFAVRELARVRLVGREGVIEVCELAGKSTDLTPEARELLSRYGEAMKRYLARDFSGAREIFGECAELDANDSVARTWLGISKKLESNPPPDDWDGTYVQKGK